MVHSAPTHADADVRRRRAAAKLPQTSRCCAAATTAASTMLPPRCRWRAVPCLRAAAMLSPMLRCHVCCHRAAAVALCAATGLPAAATAADAAKLPPMATPGSDGSSAGAGAVSFSILEGVATMGAGGGAVLPFFCLLALCDDMVGGGGKIGSGAIFLVRRAFSKHPPHQKKSQGS